MNEWKKKSRSRSGFTLIEVLLVVAILGILATVVAVNLSGKDKHARIMATRASINAICTAVEVYELNCGNFPASLQNLITSSGEPNWQGPYLRGGLPNDPWGTPFTFTPRGDSDYEVRSAGPDKQTGSGDDITNATI